MSDGANTASPVPTVGLFPVRLGDGDRQAPGLLVVCDAAIRAILTASEEGEIIHGFACDRRVMPPDGLMVFHRLDDALTWFERRLGARRSAASLPAIGRERAGATSADAEVSLAAERAARRRFFNAADAYCSTMQEFVLPQERMLRRMMEAWQAWRHIADAMSDRKAAHVRTGPLRDRRAR